MKGAADRNDKSKDEIKILLYYTTFDVFTLVSDNLRSRKLEKNDFKEFLHLSSIRHEVVVERLSTFAQKSVYHQNLSLKDKQIVILQKKII